MEYFQSFAIATISSLSTTIILGFVCYIARSWIIERLKASVKHEYDLKLLEFETKKEIRLKAEIVAELLADWIKDEHELDYYKLNKLSFQAYIWLPEKLAEDLSNTLAKNKGSKDVRLLLQDIRKHLLGEDDHLDSKYVIVFRKSDGSYGQPRFNTRIKSEATTVLRPKQ